MDVLRDHPQNDLRHDLDDRRVRCNVNRRDHHVMVEKTGQNDLRNHETKCHRVDLTIDSPCYVGHRLLSADRHRMGYHGVDDLKLGVNLGVNRGHHMNDRLGGHSMGVDRHDVLGDLRMNAMDDLNDLAMVLSRVNRSCAPRDRKTDVSSDENHDLRMNDLLGDHSMDDDLHDQNLVVNRVNRNCALHDPKMDVNLDVSRDRRMNDRLDDRNLDVMMVVNLYRHMNVMDDRNDLMMVVNLLNRNCALHDPKMVVNLDVSRVNRNCVRHDQMTDVNLDAMSHRVKLTGDRSTSCDRMSRDHLQCDHQMMRHRDTNRMDVKNLDAMKMMNHRVNRRMMDDLMKVGPKMI